jgi:diguanylate cyclase (GGDEF)-like protein/PAS domain S-box-containing protein
MDAPGSILEAERLASLRRYQLLDTPADRTFDRVTAIAARLFKVPIALISLVDRDRIWFKSRYGLDIPQINREPGLCASAILQNDVYEVTNALVDPRTLNHPLVRGDLGLRFYAAAPLTNPAGYHLGTLGIMDRQPRHLTAAETETLKDLAAMVMDEMELRLSARLLVTTTEAQQANIQDLYQRAPCGYHSLDENGRYIAINDTELEWLGYRREQVVGQLCFADVLTPASQITFAANFPVFKRRGQVHNLEFEMVRADGSTLWVLINAIAEFDPQGNFVKSRSTVHNISDRKQAELTLLHLNESLESLVVDRTHQLVERTAQLAERNHDLEQTNRDLYLSNLRFRNAFDYASTGMALVSLSGNWIQVNRSLCEMTGYSEAELLATDFRCMTHPDDLATDLDQVQRLLEGTISHYYLEKRYRHKQGHWIWILLSGSLVRDLQQQPLYFVAQIQNIHERKQAELALKKSQAMLLEAQAMGHIGSWEYEVATGKVTWSAEKFRILGRDPALGEPSLEELLRLYHPEDGDLLRQAIDTLLTTGTPYSLRLKCTRGDGSIRHLEDRGEAEYDQQGQVLRLFGIVQDITEQVQAEQDRQEMSTALSHAVEGISRLDTGGHYRSVNQAYAEMLGYTPAELVGQPWTLTVHPEDLPAVTAAHQTMLQQGKAQVEARGQRKDGSVFYKQLVMVAVYDDQHRLSGHFCFTQDISDRKQAELALQQELQRLSEVITTQQEVALNTPDNEQVTAIVMAHAQHLTGAEGAAIELLEGQELVGRAATGLAQPHLGWRLPLDASLSGRCLTTGQALYCQDITQDERVNVPWARSLGLRTMAVVPLIYQTERFGVLKVVSTQPTALIETTQQTLQLLAGLLAASLHLTAIFEAKNTLLQQLQDSEVRYRSVVSALSEGIVMLQADGTLSACNASAAKILARSRDRLLNQRITDLGITLVREGGDPCPMADSPPLITLRTGQPTSNTVLGLVQPTGITWISMNTRPLVHGDQAHPDAVVVSFMDITELRRSEVAALRRQAARERLLSEIAQRIRQTLDLEAILTTTVREVQHFLHTDQVMIYRVEPEGSGTIIAEAIAPGCRSLLGQVHPPLAASQLAFYQAGHLQVCADLPSQPAPLCPLDSLTQARAKIAVPIVQSNRLWGMLLVYHHAPGPRPWTTEEIDVLQRLAIQLAIAIQQSQLYQRLQAVNQQLEHLATHDGLTQVDNRRSFDTHLQQEWHRLLREQAPLSLILCDIDYFKGYNDTYGHPAGDVCLQKIAQTLTQVVKRPSDLVARYGGEEFALVLPTTDGEGAEAIAIAIQQALAEIALFHGASPISTHLTLSLGIATAIPTAEQTPQTLIDAADGALYAAKRQGRNRYCIAT